jgi:hypothetical protein
MSNKEDKSPIEKFMLEAIRKGTADFKINGDILTEDDSFDIVTSMILFQIELPRTSEIVTYLKRLMKDHKESAADVLRDIYHDMIGHEKYFAAYILGKNFKAHFSKIETEKEFAIFIDPISQKLDVSNLLLMTEYVNNMTKQEDLAVSPAYGIKKIIDSDFEENDKVFLVFLYAII